jgi:hypothetical protein
VEDGVSFRLPLHGAATLLNPIEEVAPVEEKPVPPLGMGYGTGRNQGVNPGVAQARYFAGKGKAPGFVGGCGGGSPHALKFFAHGIGHNWAKETRKEKLEVGQICHFLVGFDSTPKKIARILKKERTGGQRASCTGAKGNLPFYLFTKSYSPFNCIDGTPFFFSGCLDCVSPVHPFHIYKVFY